MPNIREITIQWGMANSPGGTSVLYFDPGTPVADQRQALFDYWTAVKGLFAASTSFRVPNEGREIDDETGTLTGEWSDAPTFNQPGTAGAGPVAGATMGLLRFTTAAIVNGRRLKGRMFLPGLTKDVVVGGELQIANQLTLADAWRSSVIEDAVQLVWSRPFDGAVGPPARPARAGSSSAVNTVTCWNEFAVLRNRR